MDDGDGQEFDTTGGGDGARRRTPKRRALLRVPDTVQGKRLLPFPFAEKKWENGFLLSR